MSGVAGTDGPESAAAPTAPGPVAPLLPFSAEPRARMRWWPMLVLALLKLVLVSQDEIRTVTADDSGYALSAASWYWGADFAPYSYGRQPLYPLCIAVSQVFGVPYRVWAELGWIAACIVAARALNACGLRRGLALGACALVMFHPTSIKLLERLLPDTLYTAAWLVLVPALAASLCQTTRRAMIRWGITAMVGAMVAANARPEALLVWGVLALGIVLIVLTRVLGWAREPALWVRLGLCVLLPAAGTIALTQGFAAANKARIGVRVTHDLDLPGFKALYGALVAIPPDDPRLLLPIPRDARERAYAASPAFRRLQPFLDGDRRNVAYSAACFDQTGVEGEFGAWSVWVLRDAAWALNGYKWPSAAALDEFYAQCAGELRAAMREGTLPSRAVPVSFVPPEWRLLARQLPTSLRACWRSLKRIGGGPIAEEAVQPQFERSFDAAGGRRITLLALNKGGSPAKPAGWQGERVRERLAALRLGITSVGRGVVPFIPFVALGGTLVALAVPWRNPRSWPARRRGLVVLLIMVWGAGLARWFFVALLDANGISSQERYMFPAGVMLALLLPISVGAAFESVRALIRRDPAPPAAAAP